MKKLGLVFSFLFICFCLSVPSAVTFGDDCPETVDQQQLIDGTLAGFGEFDISGGKEGVRYRGQGFTPELPVLTAIEFSLKYVGFTDIRVFIDTAKDDSTPEHDIDGAIFSFTIPNSELEEGKKKYVLPEEINLEQGKKYVVYFAPYKNEEYCDDYRDMVWSLGNPYCGGDGVVNINGCWSVSDWGDIDLQFKTYGRECGGEPTPIPTGTGQPTPSPTGTPIDDGGGNGGGSGGGGGGGGGSQTLRVLRTSPEMGEINVDPDLTEIDVRFNIAMDESGYITPSSIVLTEKDTGVEISLSSVEVSFGGKVLYLLTAGSLKHGTVYKAKIIKDKVRAANAGINNLEADYIWSFTTDEQPTPTPTPTPSAKPSPTTSYYPTPTPSAKPSPTPIVTPTPTAKPSPSPVFTPTPTPIPEEGVIYGRVRSIHGNHPPLGGVKVLLLKREDGKWKKYAVKKTKKNGKYRLEELPPGSYRLEFSKPEWITIKRRVRLEEGEIRELNIVLDP